MGCDGTQRHEMDGTWLDQTRRDGMGRGRGEDRKGGKRRGEERKDEMRRGDMRWDETRRDETRWEKMTATNIIYGILPKDPNKSDISSRLSICPRSSGSAHLAQPKPPLNSIEINCSFNEGTWLQASALTLYVYPDEQTSTYITLVQSLQTSFAYSPNHLLLLPPHCHTTNYLNIR